MQLVDLDSGNESEDSADDDVVRSPTGLRYNIKHLPASTQEAVRTAFQEPSDDLPELTFVWASRKKSTTGTGQESPSDAAYAFQIHEVKPRSVRIGSPQGSYPEPDCQCGEAAPCQHVIWVADQIAKQVLPEHDPAMPLNLNEHGYADELSNGRLYHRMADMRLDVLADGLRCNVSQASSPPRSSAGRREDARELLAAIAGITGREFDDDHGLVAHRRDLQDPALDTTKLIHSADPEATLFSVLLLASDRLAGRLRTQLQPSEPPCDPFRRMHRRVVRIIADLDVWGWSTLDATLAAERAASGVDAEGQRDVEWAARSIQNSVAQIEATIAHRTEHGPGLAPWERTAAARALVRILRAIAEANRDAPPNNTWYARLYERLIGVRGTTFTRRGLAMLQDQRDFVDELEDIFDIIGETGGAAADWWDDMHRICERMRRSRAGRSAATVSGTTSTSSTPGEGLIGRKGKGKQVSEERTMLPPPTPVTAGGEGPSSTFWPGPFAVSGESEKRDLWSEYAAAQALAAPQQAPEAVEPARTEKPGRTSGRADSSGKRGSSSGAGTKRTGSGAVSGSKRAR